MVLLPSVRDDARVLVPGTCQHRQGHADQKKGDPAAAFIILIVVWKN